MDPLPNCEHRQETPQPGMFYCRHSEVRPKDDLVSSTICARCNVFDQPSRTASESGPHSSASQAPHLDAAGVESDGSFGGLCG